VLEISSKLTILVSTTLCSQKLGGFGGWLMVIYPGVKLCYNGGGQVTVNPPVLGEDGDGMLPFCEPCLPS